jgi:alpha-L-rhamnosidase
MAPSRPFDALSRRGVLAGAAAVALAPAAASRAGAAAAKPAGLMANLLPRPAGVTADAVRLTWEVPRLGPSTMQSAYQIRITAAGAASPVWDSGKIVSDRSTAVPVAEGRLRPDTAYDWRVRVWDRDRVSDWSAPQRLITAAGPRWAAKPIWVRAGAPIDSGDDLARWLLARCDVMADGEVEAAWLKAAALSPEKTRQYVFRLHVNGVLAGVGPARSPNPAEVAVFHTYDVTALVRPGANTLSALCYAVDGKALLAELTLLYKDGRTQVVGTGPDWRVSDGEAWRPDGGITRGGYYTVPQEDIDARHEPAGWMMPGFDAGAWSAPVERAPLPALVPAETENITLSALRPAAVTALAPGRWRIDFGKEVVGGLRLSVDGRDGQALDIRLGEELNPDGSVRYELRCGQTYREAWTLRNGPQVLEHWGYRAFRWLEVRSDGDLDLANAIEAVVLKLPWRADDAAFTSSNPDLDRVWELCRYSIEALRLDVYQDTPTRERGPYEGDAIVNQLSEYAVQRSYALARYSTHFLLNRPTWPTEYRLQTPVLAWRDYLATGDAAALARDYDGMAARQLFDLIDARNLVEKDPEHPTRDLVDWPKSNLDGYVFTRVNTVINAWQFLALQSLGGIAGVLGKSEDQKRFADAAGALRRAMNTSLRMSDGRYRDGIGTDHSAQHATAFPVAFGIPDDAGRADSGRGLARQNMKVSVYGAQFLLDALYASGEADAALRLMTSHDLFSWLHMIDDLKATLTTEAWDPSIKPNTTFSHAWATAPANVVQRHIAGVEVVAAGASRIRIAPQPGGLERFRAKVPTIRGPVCVAYDRNGPVRLDIEVPPNVTADLDLGGLKLSGPARLEAEGYVPEVVAGTGGRVHRLRPGKVRVV